MKTVRGGGCSLVGAVIWLAAAALAHAQDEVIPLIVELLGDKDKEVRSLALEQVRTEVQGEAATLKFAELLPTLPPETPLIRPIDLAKVRG